MLNPGAGLALVHDTSVRADWINIIQTGVEAFGPITVLVNNTGIQPATSCWQSPDVKSVKTKNVDAWAHFTGMETVVPFMKRAGIGSIVEVAPLELHDASAYVDTLATGQRAVNAFLRTIAAELASFNIRVNVIARGPVGKPRMQDALSLSSSAEDISGDGYFDSPRLADDVGQLVLYLASDESSPMTGILHIIGCTSSNVREH